MEVNKEIMGRVVSKTLYANKFIAKLPVILLALAVIVWLLASSITFVPWALAPMYLNIAAAACSVPALLRLGRWARLVALVILVVSVCAAYGSYSCVNEYRLAHPDWSGH